MIFIKNSDERSNKGLPNVISPIMEVCLIVDSPTAILLNVCSPNQPLTKRAFIANLYTLPNLTHYYDCSPTASLPNHF